jgi:hypothetical protein
MRDLSAATIGFPQDKLWRDWTFNYYSRAAQYSLQHLERSWKDLAPTYVSRIRTPAERWDYCQEQLEEAITNFTKALKKTRDSKKNNQAKSSQRAEKRRKRKLVRKMILDAR